MDHLILFDAQVEPGTPTDHIEAAGLMIMDRRPDVIVIIGDWWDFASLETFSAPQLIGYERRAYIDDYDAGVDALRILLKPMREFNKKRRMCKKAQYRPRLVFTGGNHEDRVNRLLSQQTVLRGSLPRAEDYLRDQGFEVYKFKDEVTIDGVAYCHLCPQPLSAGGVGRAHLIAAKRHSSWTTGHIQILDYHVSQHLPRIQCLICGAFYMDDKGYKRGSNDHWRGLAYKTNVHYGTYDLELLSIEGLLEEYPEENQGKPNEH